MHIQEFFEIQRERTIREYIKVATGTIIFLSLIIGFISTRKEGICLHLSVMAFYCNHKWSLTCSISIINFCSFLNQEFAQLCVSCACCTMQRGASDLHEVIVRHITQVEVMIFSIATEWLSPKL